jgi:hypothetical protein
MEHVDRTLAVFLAEFVDAQTARGRRSDSRAVEQSVLPRARPRGASRRPIHPPANHPCTSEREDRKAPAGGCSKSLVPPVVLSAAERKVVLQRRWHDANLKAAPQPAAYRGPQRAPTETVR